MAMQRPLPFGSMTALENVVLGAMFGVDRGVVGEREARRRAKESLEFVGARRADQPVSSLNLHELRSSSSRRRSRGSRRCCCSTR